MPSVVERLRRTLNGLFPEPAPDPFRTLELQSRLTRLAGELETLDSAGWRGYALGHHATAALSAYEHTLAEACRLMDPSCAVGTGAVHRLLAETALREAGWSW